MSKLNKLIASFLNSALTTAGLVMLLIGLGLGFLIAISPFLLIGIVAILGIVLYAFRAKLDINAVREELRSMRQKDSPRPPSLREEAPKTEKKEEPKEDKQEEKEERRPKRIIIEV